MGLNVNAIFQQKKKIIRDFSKNTIDRETTKSQGKWKQNCTLNALKIRPKGVVKSRIIYGEELLEV